jgi:hypothetical protein
LIRIKLLHRTAAILPQLIVEKEMITSRHILHGAIAGVVLCGTAFAAPAVQGTRSAPARPDCQKLGSEVSALIDNRSDSPNIAAARSIFQVGIMECMEGADDAASRHYDDAKKLLAGDEQKPTAAIQVPNAGR